MRTLMIAALTASCLLGAAPAWAFPPGRSGGWSDVTADVRLRRNARVIAVADWTNSQQSDLITVVNSTVAVSSWRRGPHSFEDTYSWDLFPEEVLSAVVADVNADGNVDLVIATTSGKLNIVYGPDRLVRDVLPSTPLHPTIPHLNVLNLFGRCALPDLVVLTAAGDLQILRSALGEGMSSCGRVGGNVTFRPEAPKALSSPLAALKVAAVDFDGDCRADFVTPLPSSTAAVTNMAVLETPSDQRPRQTFNIPSFFGVPSYGDMNGDGAVDVVFPACVTPTLVGGTTDVFECTRYDAVAVLRNGVSGRICGTDSCCDGHGSRLPSVTFTAADGYKSDGGFAVYPLGCQRFNPLTPPGEYDPATAEDTALLNAPSYPALVRLLDYNRDTRIDMVVGTEWGPMVLTNRGDYITCDALDPAAAKSSEAFRQSVPFPFDISEDGAVDIIMFPTGSNGTMQAYWNGYSLDENYFFTATMLNGVDGQGYPYWGAIQPGAVHRFQWQDVDTNTRTGAVTQYATSSAHMLLLPHAHFGLGRTFSPIQNYGSGVRNNAEEHKRDWTAYLMPNSQVVVLARPITDPSQWTLRLFLYSMGFKKIILIALPTVLALIGIPIFVLRCRELQFDRAEKRQQMS